MHSLSPECKFFHFIFYTFINFSFKQNDNTGIIFGTWWPQLSLFPFGMLPNSMYKYLSHNTCIYVFFVCRLWVENQ